MIKNSNIKGDVYSRASLSDLMTAVPMSAEAHAALLRRKTATRRSIEDRRVASQVLEEPYGKAG
jgi:hypothetical protein